MSRVQRKIFRNASVTHFFSSIFFTGQIKDDVFTLYGFARVADDLIDEETDTKKYFEFKNKYYAAVTGQKSNDIIIDDFVELQKRVDINQEWIDSLFQGLEMDITPRAYKNMSELEKDFMYGVAGTIGLMMCKVLSVPENAYPYALQMGYAGQYANILRDIAEDKLRGRQYIPESELHKYGITSLDKEYLLENKSKFEKLMHSQIAKYHEYTAEARKGFKFIPVKYLVPIKTVLDMYDFTMNTIESDPFIIFTHKVKPRKRRVILQALSNLLVRD